MHIDPIAKHFELISNEKPCKIVNDLFDDLQQSTSEVEQKRDYFPKL